MNTAIAAPDYHCSITVGISAREEKKKISRVQDWWTRSFEGSAQKTGDEFTVRFGETFVTFKIGEVVPGKLAIWLVQDCQLHWLKDKKEWNGTEIVWKVTSQGGSTRVDMTHVGLAPGIECYDMCENGWNSYVAGSLFKLLTEGEGHPDKKQ